MYQQGLGTTLKALTAKAEKAALAEKLKFNATYQLLRQLIARLGDQFFATSELVKSANTKLKELSMGPAQELFEQNQQLVAKEKAEEKAEEKAKEKEKIPQQHIPPQALRDLETQSRAFWVGVTVWKKTFLEKSKLAEVCQQELEKSISCYQSHEIILLRKKLREILALLARLERSMLVSMANSDGGRDSGTHEQMAQMGTMVSSTFQQWVVSESQNVKRNAFICTLNAVFFWYFICPDIFVSN